MGGRQGQATPPQEQDYGPWQDTADRVSRCASPSIVSVCSPNGFLHEEGCTRKRGLVIGRLKAQRHCLGQRKEVKA